MSPEEDRTRDAVDSEPKHYQLSYSGPSLLVSAARVLQTVLRIQVAAGHNRYRPQTY